MKKLTGLLTDRIGKVKVTVDCADDVSRDFKNLGDLIAFENPRSKAIRRIHITAHSDDHTKRASIDLSGSRWRGISFTLDARDDVVSRMRADLLDIIAGMRPWYSFVHRIDFVTFAFLAFLSLITCAIVIVELGPKSNKPESQSSQSSQLIGYVFIAGLFGAGIALNWFRDSLFPRAVFRIGQGDTRFRTLERFQWGVAIALAVSFVAGLPIAILQTL